MIKTKEASEAEVESREMLERWNDLIEITGQAIVGRNLGRSLGLGRESRKIEEAQKIAENKKGEVWFQKKIQLQRKGYSFTFEWIPTNRRESGEIKLLAAYEKKNEGKIDPVHDDVNSIWVSASIDGDLVDPILLWDKDGGLYPREISSQEVIVAVTKIIEEMQEQISESEAALEKEIATLKVKKTRNAVKRILESFR